MAYITQTDIQRAIGADLVLRLLDDDNDGTVDASTLTDLIADVDAEINGYIGQVYSPATLAADPPATLRRLAVDVAVQLAYLRRPELLNERGETPWEARYKRALKKLDEIRKGEFRLDVDADPARPANVRGAGLYSSTGAVDATDLGFIKDGSGDF